MDKKFRMKYLPIKKKKEKKKKEKNTLLEKNENM